MKITLDELSVLVYELKSKPKCKIHGSSGLTICLDCREYLGCDGCAELICYCRADD